MLWGKYNNTQYGLALSHKHSALKQSENQKQQNNLSNS